MSKGVKSPEVKKVECQIALILLNTIKLPSHIKVITSTHKFIQPSNILLIKISIFQRNLDDTPGNYTLYSTTPWCYAMTDPHEAQSQVSVTIVIYATS